MSAIHPNVAASVRARLLNVAKAQGVDFNQVLVRFALEHALRCQFQQLDNTVDAC